MLPARPRWVVEEESHHFEPLFILSTNVPEQLLDVRSDAKTREFDGLLCLSRSLAQGMAPGIISLGPPGTPASPKVNETPIISFLTQLRLRLYFSPGLWLRSFSLSHFTHWVQLLPELEMLLRQSCPDDAFGPSKYSVFCVPPGSIIKRRKERKNNTNWIFIMYQGQVWDLSHVLLSIIYTIVCIPEPIVLLSVSALPRGWLR